MNARGKPWIFETILLPFVLLLGLGNSETNPNSQTPVPYLEVNLAKIGYHAETEPTYRDQEIFGNPSLLYDDSLTRLVFGYNRVLALFLNHSSQTSAATRERNRAMVAFFVNGDSGSLISQRTWKTRPRRWLNDLWDTEARIFPVKGGFLVQADGQLIRYSLNLDEMKRIALEHTEHTDNVSWSVSIPPNGMSIHLQRISNQKTAQGVWLDSKSLANIAEQQEFPGVSSASSAAVVGRLVNCYGLQVLGEPPTQICPEPCEFGIPTFLTERDILSVFFTGFQVLSVDGSPLWGIRQGDTRACGPHRPFLIGNHRRSLDGTKFAVSIEAYERASFDGVDLPQHRFTILVYDFATRSRVFRVTIPGTSEHINQLDFDLSPNGDALAVLSDNMLRIYRIDR